MVFLTRLLARRLTKKYRLRLNKVVEWDHPLYGPGRTPPEGRMKGLMKGAYPVTRTREYLSQGIVFRDCVKVMTINYGNYEHNYESHSGIRDVINMNVPQLRYANPDVHIEILENITPTPFITFYLESGDTFHVDVEGQKQFDILKRLQKVIGKPKQLIEEKIMPENTANFGKMFTRKCICMVEGQVPCSSSLHSTPGYAMALHGKQMNLNPKKWVHGKDD